MSEEHGDLELHEKTLHLHCGEVRDGSHDYVEFSERVIGRGIWVDSAETGYDTGENTTIYLSEAQTVKLQQWLKNHHRRLQSKRESVQDIDD